MSVYTCQFTFSEAEINGEGISTRKCYALVQFTKFVYSWRGKKKKNPKQSRNKIIYTYTSESRVSMEIYNHMFNFNSTTVWSREMKMNSVIMTLEHQGWSENK